MTRNSPHAPKTATQTIQTTQASQITQTSTLPRSPATAPSKLPPRTTSISHSSAARSHPSTSDLRRNNRRDLVERLLDRATCLPPADLALLRAAYHDGRSASELAILLGADARGIRRRIRRLSDRVLSQQFLFVLRHRDSWPPTRRNVATAMILHGCSQRQATRELKLTLYTVRKNYLEVLALYETASSRSSASMR